MDLMQKLDVQDGAPTPFGAQWTAGGANFALFTSGAKAVKLHLYVPTEEGGVQKLDTLSFDPEENRLADCWFLEVKDLPDTVLYTYTIDGSPELLDPYAKEVWCPGSWGTRPPGLPYRPYGVLRKTEPFRWEGIKSPNTPLRDLIIYELHVRGFTASPTSGVHHPGTYLGMIEKIPYLIELGVNAVELLPITEFDECASMRTYLPTKGTLLNYWGYSPVNFFAPMQRYAWANKPGSASDELKLLVRELHRHGIEVILDVVFNHTSESGRLGPLHSFRGFAPNAFYMINSDRQYLDFTGCGNTFNANSPLGMELLISALRHWVTEYHIDGFRFDLASALTRAYDGTPLANPPLISAMNNDPLLRATKLIAEPWDTGGLYHVGNFPCHETIWAEWNGLFRDNVRRFIKGNENDEGAFATRLCGSEDLYSGRSPDKGINFITCHDGFTLRDLVSYNEKHNLDNGEENRDGSNNNDSWNCGAEGETPDANILKLRSKQMKNLITALMIAQGTPLMRMGDEYGHTLMGNNNTWCQDNPLNWVDWSKIRQESGLQRFYKSMIRFRREHKILRSPYFLSDRDVQWHGLKPFKQNWGKKDLFLAFTLKDHEQSHDLYIAFNPSWKKRVVTLPDPPRGLCWARIIDTSQASPKDIVSDGDAKHLRLGQINMAPYSTILLKAL